MVRLVFLLLSGVMLLFVNGKWVKDEAVKPSLGKTPGEVIEAYVQAIGGADKINQIKTLVLVMEATVQGMEVEMSTIRDMEQMRMMQQIVMEGNVVQKTVVKGNEGYMSAMGQVQNLTTDQLETLKTNIFAFPELHYERMGFTMTMGENEEINGEEAYTLLLNNGEGMKSKEFFSVATGLKLKMETDIAGDVEFMDYQEIEGILFPMKINISNPMIPVPLETRVIDIQINQALDDSMFE
ncbi:peptidase, M16 family protein [Cyclobacterium plantarum]|uniref:Peptidase, M16 family protein n=1 Tax=Cyclobacterium plantarum TaxID=2716263 RepID=A0ABX0HH58_9BACT|nr:peptidase, M16 family protein [Cyclobacterium plantarum]NHE59482.1 peptidase, M16 family protein [Cyclobacterium plantarum]